MYTKYPSIEVGLSDGNAFAIMGTVRKALERNGVPREEIDLFTKEATSGDYDKLLQTVMGWVEVTQAP